MNASGRASHLCPLFRAFNDGNLGYGIDDGIVKFTTAGLDANKIIVGGAFYGKAYTVKGTGNYESKYPALGAPAELNSLQYASGTVTYKYISKNILTDSSYKRYFDNEAKVPYLYSASKKSLSHMKMLNLYNLKRNMPMKWYGNNVLGIWL